MFETNIFTSAHFHLSATNFLPVFQSLLYQFNLSLTYLCKGNESAE